MKRLSLSFTNITIKPTKQLAAKFKFAFVKDYIHLYNKDHENTNEYVLLDNQELSNPDLSPGNENYTSHEDVIYPSIKPKTVYPNANSSIEKLEISSDPGSYSSETSSESNDHSNIYRNDNASTNLFGGTLDKYNRESQNSGTDKRKSSLKDAGFNGFASVEDIGNFGNNSRSTVDSTENIDANKTITSGIDDTKSSGINNTEPPNTGTNSGNTPTSDDNKNKPNEPEKKPKTIKIIGIIVISIVLFGVSVYFYFIIKRIYFTEKEVEYVY